MSGHTKGRVVACCDQHSLERNRRLDTDDVATEDGRPICRMTGDVKHAYDDARLIAEAFNVAAETGRTPSELAAERAELVGMCEAVKPLLVLLAAKMNSPKEVVNTIGAIDAILAKVKGPVQ